ncbi:MAG: hypothetical protein BWY63_02470 [Chloroflexi bacterium ADurb.Bin360]|nr:MAG: hypothetical protein BWY63_02470 [Chloroflexi bacterium ADurb.Bin360]
MTLPASILKFSKRLVRTTLNRVGYDIQRLSQKMAPIGVVDYLAGADPENARSNRGWLVEFIGPSGIGKTALFDEMVARRKPEHGWLTPAESLCWFDQQPVSAPLHDIYEKLLLLKLQEVSLLAIAPSDKYRLLAFFNENLQLDADLNRLELKAPVVCHDGLFHNFSSCLLALDGDDPSGFNRLIQNRAFVHCSASAQLIAERILKRNAGGQARPHHRDLTEQELSVQSAKVLEQNSDLVARLKNAGSPCLDLDMAHETGRNIEAVQHFIDSLTSLGVVWRPDFLGTAISTKRHDYPDADALPAVMEGNR